MHGRLLPTHNSPEVELGDEPPLAIYDERNQLPDRRQVSTRWLAGTILTGFTSIFLMGGALTAALDGQYRLTEVPSPEKTRNVGKSANHTPAASTKGDRIARSAMQFASRQIIPVSTVNRVGDRDFIKVRPYALVTSSLVTHTARDLDLEIPPFNPLEMFADTDILPERTNSDAIYDAKIDGEVSISQRDFPVSSPIIDAHLVPSEAEIERIVRESARFLANNDMEIAARPIVDPGRFDFDLARQSELSRLSVRITPENVSFVSKSGDLDTFVGMEEKIVPITKERSFRDLLLDNEATEEEADAIVNAFSEVYGIERLSPGQRIRLAMNIADDGSERLRPERVSLYADTVHKATVARTDTGSFISAEAPTTFLADAFAEADRLGYAGPTPSVYDSLYQTAIEQDVPEELIANLVRIFSFDVDFKSRVTPGDALEVFYGLEQEDSDAPAEILFTALTTHNSTRKFYRFRTPDDGSVDFYDETGKSAKKFLMRKPINGGKFRSAFGMRRHPILGYGRMHNGVDWSAPRGTPIMAAGNGTVIRARWVSGYGRRVEIQHANGYITTYSHMSNFADGIKEGDKIRQGQIVGYIGSSGLSTGAHLHYEVKVNGRFVNPMRIRLPRGRVLEGEMLAAFERERERIDALVDRGRGPARIAATASVIK